MKVFILTSEPYHDNSAIIGIFTDEQAANAALKASVNPEDINCDDSRLLEWDLETNQKGRQWDMIGKQVWEGSSPIRKEFTLNYLE